MKKEKTKQELLMDELDRKARKLSQNCSWCKARLPRTQEHYDQFGNCCQVCSGLFSKMIKGKLNKDGKKIRSYTKEEKDKMIEDRKTMVRFNKI